MKIRCEYCHNYLDDTMNFCPSCGAANDKMIRSAIGIPKTIEELKQYIEQNNIPVEQLRFFIGENYQGAKAFGIYKEDGNCIVYKNKADGSRIVRYRGTDEAYAVNEIYQKLKIEFQEAKARKQSLNQNQEQWRDQSTNYSPRDRKKKHLGCGTIFFAILIMYFAMCFIGAVFDTVSSYGHSLSSGYGSGYGSGYSSSYGSSYGSGYGSDYGSGYEGSGYSGNYFDSFWDDEDDYDYDGSYSYGNDNSSSWFDSNDSWDNGTWNDDSWDDDDWNWGSDSSWDSDSGWDSWDSWDSGSDWDSDW